MLVLNPARAARRLSVGLRAAGVDLVTSRGIAYASPALAFPLVYMLAYGAGAVLHVDSTGDRAPLFALAVVGGLVAYFLGLGLAWRRPAIRPDPAAGAASPRLPVAALACVVAGVVASIAYLAMIGAIPLLLPDVEQARVEAAERGGAALRVTALIALPGVWLLAGQAGARRTLGAIAIAVAAAVVVAGLQLLTANRAPAFLTVEVAVLAFLLGAGVRRLRPVGVILLGSLAIALVVAAGVIGGYRLGATPATWRDPEIARALAAGNSVALTGEAIRNYAVVPIQNFSSVLDAVPTLIDWRLGYTYLQPLVTVLPGRQTTFDQDLKVALEQDYAGGGTVPSLLGEAYANFGPIGWLIVPAALGAVLAALYRFARERDTVAAWVLYAWIIVHLANATISGIIVANIFPYLAVMVLGAAALASTASRGAHRARTA